MAHFSGFQPTPITNFKTGELYTLQRIDKMVFSAENYTQIVNVCNEPKVYDLLFASRLNGKPYTDADARGFITWGTGGWQKNDFFLFFITSPTGEIVAAIDVKSDDLMSAEIGYWCSQHHGGIMTNTVAALCAAMKASGYFKAHALVLPTNPASSNVLKRNDFAKIGTQSLADGKQYDKYSLLLSDG